MKWVLIAPTLVWLFACLAVIGYMVKSIVIRDLHSDDYFVFVCLFFTLLFMPFWYPVKYFYQRRESAKIKKYVKGIREKSNN